MTDQLNADPFKLSFPFPENCLQKMIDTFLFIAVILLLISFLTIAFLKRKPTKSKTFFMGFFLLGCAIIIYLLTGPGKIRSDISRLIYNSSPRKAYEVYTLLFKKPTDHCLSVINFNDQVIPRIDCCIWMEVEVCPEELLRISNLRKYKTEKINKNDSLLFLSLFGDRPSWWAPQMLADSLTKLNIKFDENNEQTLFFGNDSTHLFICDKAL